jgi:hypothetical protein
VERNYSGKKVFWLIGANAPIIKIHFKCQSGFPGKKFLETPYDIFFGLLKFDLFDMLDCEMFVTPLN